MPIILTEISSTDKKLFEHLFQYYLYDMSEFSGGAFSRDGTFSYPLDLLSPYWAEKDHHPYFIVSQGEIAGFSLVRRSPENNQVWDMGQFFVLRKFRGKNIGKLALQKSLLRHPGQWQIRVLIDNRPAYHFWRTRINDVAVSNVSEEIRTYHKFNMTFFTFQAGS